jgi:hypothetical protein
MMRHVNLLSKLAVIGLFMVIAGCASQPIAIPTIATPPPVSIPVPTPTNLQNMKYQLVTSQTLPTFTATFQANPNQQFYVLDRTNMEIMISNVQELRSYILQQQATINYLAGVLKSQQYQGNGVANTGSNPPAIPASSASTSKLLSLFASPSNIVSKLEKK